MLAHLQQVYHLAQVALSLVGLGTVVKALPNGIQWLLKRWNKLLEGIVLTTFHNIEGPWQSAHGVVGELQIRAAFRDKWGYLPTRSTGWRAYVHLLLVAPYYRWRHHLRGVFLIPSKEKADKILRDLWERNLLVRAGWEHTNNEVYRLRN